jgi:hypothetical protein
MANAVRDDNNVPALIGALNTDGATSTRVLADPTAHYMFTKNGSGGSDLTGDIAPRDGNLIPFAMAASEVDGVTPVVLYVTADGELLVKTS